MAFSDSTKIWFATLANATYHIKYVFQYKLKKGARKLISKKA
ncbi:MAG: hypothetical protein PUI02_02865 [Christensenellaceae bacterium]|nr:hypothetical protein [Christensenellaceae bacterium]